MLLAAALVFTWSLGSVLVKVPGIFTNILSEEELSKHYVVPTMSPRGDQGGETLPSAPPAVKDLDIRADTFSFITPQNAWKTLLIYGIRPLLATLFLGIVLIAGTVFYVWHPRRMRRKIRSRPLAESEAPELVREIKDLARRTGASPEPDLEWAPGLLDGLAFGLPGKKTLVYQSPIVRDEGMSPFSKAVVLHELGHVVNRDIGWREFARALWLVVIALSLLVATLGFVLSYAAAAHRGQPLIEALGRVWILPASPWLYWSAFVFRTAIIAAVIWLIWAGLVRAREYYADWRVVSWNMKQPLLDRLRCGSDFRSLWPNGRLARAFERRYENRRWFKLITAKIESWQHLFVTHPTHRMRIATVQEDTALFKVTPDLSLATGLLLAIIAGYIAPLLRDLGMIFLPFVSTLYWIVRDIAGHHPSVVIPASALTLYVLPFLILSAILTFLSSQISEALGTQVQRESICDLATRSASQWRYVALWRVASIFALGFELGAYITPLADLEVPGSRQVASSLGWLCGFTGLTWVWLIYVRAATRLFLGTCVGARFPAWRRRFITWSSAVLLAVLFWPASYARLSMRIADSPPPAWLNPWGFETEKMIFALIGFWIVMLLGMAFFLYTTFVGLVIAARALWLVFRRTVCPSCSTAIHGRIAVGRHCPRCEQNLAPWAYMRSREDSS